MNKTPEVFLDYVRPHLRALHAAARQYAALPDDVGDLVQETLLRGWRGFAPTDARTYCRAWLFVIMRRVAMEWHRAAAHRIRIVPMPDTELTDLAGPDSESSLTPLPVMTEKRFRQFLDDRIAAALDALEPPFREVIVLYVAGGLSYREIGEVLGCPVGTVMSRMSRARRMLRERLADHASAPIHVKGGRP